MTNREEHAKNISSAWNDDWGKTIAEVCEATGLSRTDALLYFLLMRVRNLVSIIEQRRPMLTEEDLEQHRKITRKIAEEIDDEESWRERAT